MLTMVWTPAFAGVTIENKGDNKETVMPAEAGIHDVELVSWSIISLPCHSSTFHYSQMKPQELSIDMLRGFNSQVQHVRF